MRAARLHDPADDDAFPGAALSTRCGGAFAYLEVRRGRVEGPQVFAPEGSGVRADTTIWLGCISKPFVATALMLLADRGELALEDTVNRFVPGVPAPARDVTIEQLLTHTSGFPRNVPGKWSFFDEDWLAEPLESAVTRLVGCVQPTGGARHYSSVGYAVLGRIVEIVASTELGTFVAREVFAPLGMCGSCCINDMPPRLVDRVAPVVTRSSSVPTVVFDPRSCRPIRNSMPFAGFFSTAADLARFLEIYFDRGGSLLREETVARMLHEHVVGQGIHQAMGWFLAFPARGGTAMRPCGVWHTASTGSLLAADLDRRAAVIVLGQALLDKDLVPVRVAEWMHVEQFLGIRPRAAAAPEAADAPPWMAELSDTSERSALSTTPADTREVPCSFR